MIRFKRIGSPWLLVMVFLIGCSGGEPAEDSNAAQNTVPDDQQHAAAPSTPSVNTPSVGTNDSAASPQTPDGAIRAIAKGLNGNDAGVIWQSLPASYQKDINDIVHEFAGRMDPEIWNKAFVVAQKAVKVLDTKKEIILNYPALQNAPLPPENRGPVYDSLVGLIGTLVSSDISDISRLKTIDMGEYVSMTGSRLMEQATQLAELTSQGPSNPGAMQFSFSMEFGISDVKVLENDGQTAQVELTFPDGRTEQQEVVLVEGKWVPADTAKDWEKNVAEVKAKLAMFDPDMMAQQKPQIIQTLDQVDTFLTQLQNAKDADEFEAVLQPVIAGIQPQLQLLMAMQGGGLGSGPTIPAPTSSDEVTIVIQKEIEQEALNGILKELESLADDPNTPLTLPLVDQGKTEITLVPVKDVQAFAEKIQFAKVVEVDPQQRRIILELTK